MRGEQRLTCAFEAPPLHPKMAGGAVDSSARARLRLCILRCTDVLAPLIAGVIMKKPLLAAASTLITRVLAAMRVLALRKEP